MMNKLLLLLSFFGTYTLLSCSKTSVPEIAVSNFTDSLKKDLWGYYPFDGSNFSDLSGNNRHMQGFNGINFTQDSSGIANGALNFDGIDDFAVIDSGRNFKEGDFTIFFSFLSRNKKGRIFQKANYNDAKGASFGFGFDQDLGTQNLHFYIANSTNVCNIYTDTTNGTLLQVITNININKWYNIVLQHSNGIEKVYINGILAGSRNTPNKFFTNCTSAPFYLGMWWLGDKRSFSGAIDNLAIYTRSLTENEIKYISGIRQQ